MKVLAGPTDGQDILENISVDCTNLAALAHRQ
jgi:hypothetical protein